jgi:hypothetical protein
LIEFVEVTVGALDVVARYAGCWYKAGTTVGFCRRSVGGLVIRVQTAKSWMPGKKVDSCSWINKKRAARKVEGLGE